MKVQLFIADGKGKVTEPLSIPEFNQFPDVIFWGTRAFVVDTATLANYQDVVHYVEAFSYALPENLDSALASNLRSDGA